MNGGFLQRLDAAWKATALGGKPVRRAARLTGWALRRPYESLEELVLDAYYRRYGLETADRDWSLHANRVDLSAYVPTPWRVLRVLFPLGSLRPDDVLLEYGSGSGRVVIWVASRFPLRRIIGLDIDERMTTAAQENLKRWRGQLRCHDVEFVCEDALQFDVPDDVTVIYMFHPFQGQVFEGVLMRIRQSLARRPRTIKVVYLRPLMHDALINAGFISEREGQWRPSIGWHVYRSTTETPSHD